MPTDKRQYNLVLNEDLDNTLWEIGAELKLSALDTIRQLLATHPDMIARARTKGIILTGKVNRGGSRQAIALDEPTKGKVGQDDQTTQNSPSTPKQPTHNARPFPKSAQTGKPVSSKVRSFDPDE